MCSPGVRDRAAFLPPRAHPRPKGFGNDAELVCPERRKKIRNLTLSFLPTPPRRRPVFARRRACSRTPARAHAQLPRNSPPQYSRAQNNSTWGAPSAPPSTHTRAQRTAAACRKDWVSASLSPPRKRAQGPRVGGRADAPVCNPPRGQTPFSANQGRAVTDMPPACAKLRAPSFAVHHKTQNREIPKTRAPVWRWRRKLRAPETTAQKNPTTAAHLFLQSAGTSHPRQCHCTCCQNQ